MNERRARASEAILAGLALIVLGALGVAARQPASSKPPLPPGPPPPGGPVATALARAQAYRAARVLFRRSAIVVAVDAGQPSKRVGHGNTTGYRLFPTAVLLVVGRPGLAYAAAWQSFYRPAPGASPQGLGWSVVGTAQAGVRPTSLDALPPGERRQVLRWAANEHLPTSTMTVWPFPGEPLVVAGRPEHVQFASLAPVHGKRTLIPWTD